MASQNQDLQTLYLTKKANKPLGLKLLDGEGGAKIVVEVEKWSRADFAGLKMGHKIVFVGEKNVSNASVTCDDISKLMTESDSVLLKVIHDKDMLSLLEFGAHQRSDEFLTKVEDIQEKEEVKTKSKGKLKTGDNDVKQVTFAKESKRKLTDFWKNFKIPNVKEFNRNADTQTSFRLKDSNDVSPKSEPSDQPKQNASETESTNSKEISANSEGVQVLKVNDETSLNPIRESQSRNFSNAPKTEGDPQSGIQFIFVNKFVSFHLNAIF